MMPSSCRGVHTVFLCGQYSATSEFRYRTGKNNDIEYTMFVRDLFGIYGDRRIVFYF